MAGDSAFYKEKEAKVALKTNKKASGKILQQISKRESKLTMYGNK